MAYRYKVYKYMVIEKTAIGYRISFEGTGDDPTEKTHYVGYSRREAIRKARQDFNHVGEHFTVLEF